jgi:hypothetical protein
MACLNRLGASYSLIITQDDTGRVGMEEGGRNDTRDGRGWKAHDGGVDADEQRVGG